MTNQAFTFSDLRPSLLADIQANLTPMLIGEPGIGKSSVLKALADTMKTKVFVLSVNQLGTKEDLTGARSIKDEKTNTWRQVFFPHADVQLAIDYANDHPKENPILFLDEINRTTSDVTSAALALITERKLGTIKLPDNLRMVAAGNDDGNVISLDDASLTRMSLYHVIPDSDGFLSAQPDLNPYIVKVLKKEPELLISKPNMVSDDGAGDFASDEDEDEAPAFNPNDLFSAKSFTQQTVPRTITYTSNFLNAFGFNGKHDATEKKAFNDNLDIVVDPEVSPDILQKSLYAHSGDTEFTNALYLEIRNELIKAFSNPDTEDDTQSNDLNITIDKPQDSTIKALNDLQSIDDLNSYVSELDAKEYQNLIIYLITAEGERSVNHKIIDGLLSSLGTQIQTYNTQIDAEAKKLSTSADKDEYLKQNRLDSLDRMHNSQLVNLMNSDQYAKSRYTLDLIKHLDEHDQRTEQLRQIVALFDK